MSKTPRKKQSSTSLVASSPGHSPKKDTSSTVASASEGLGEPHKSRFPLWPEWNDTEVNAEKWDAAKSSKDSKLFDDLENKVELPASLRVHTWKRPSEYMVNKTPVVVENEAAFDLTSANEHLLSSELMRWIISEIYILWKVCNTGEAEPVSTETAGNPWRPWEHIYSLCKAVEGHIPLYNAYGKYVIKLYWMGCWRKIVVDDMLPFDQDNNLLLPATTNQAELWPMLLAKGILKVASTDVPLSSSGREGEFTVIHSLTGWIPEMIPLKSWYTGKMWEFLKEAIPKFQLEEERLEDKTTIADHTTAKDSDENDTKSESPTLPKSKATGPTPIPQMVVCASYQPLHLLEKRTSVLTQMADSSESLRQYGLSQLYSHPVLLTSTRDCPLVSPPKPPPVPNWKLIRPRKQTNITDEPKEPPVQKPEQFIGVCSPFINFRLMIMAAHDMDQGVKKRGFSSNLTSFSEMDDNEEDHTQSDVNQNSVNNSDASENNQATAEDKKTDDITNDAERAELTVNPQKEIEGKERLQTPEESNSAPPQSQDKTDKPLLLETWVDLHNFTKCFQTLLIFHKPNTYAHQCSTAHFQNSVFARMSATPLSNTVASTHSFTTPARQPDCTATVHTQSADGTHFLFVDNLLPTEFVLCFSALTQWGESVKEKRVSPPRPGFLIAKPFSWKSVVSELPVVQIQTTASKAALLKLPPGRHVLHIQTRAPVAINVQICSMSPFVFGDEETVMPHLDKESLRFCVQATLILRALGRVVSCFSDPEELPSATKELEKTHGLGIQQQRVFSEAVYHMFCCALGRKLTSEELFAVQTLTGDPSPHGSNGKATDLPSDGNPEGWKGRQATDQEMQAATVLQAGWKGYLVREILTAARPGTSENLSVTKTLEAMWASLESDFEKYAVALLGHMVANGGEIVDLYPCREDESNRITFKDYSVPVPEVTNAWILIFREVFHVHKNMLLVPKIYSPLPVSTLHVINNDTLEEVPKVFNRVEPHMYTPNKSGYTFVAEAQTGDTPLNGGKWHMRLIGSREPLPQLSNETPRNNFSVKEMKGYYIPNKKNIICRYVVKVSSDHNATVQFQTSQSDVYIKLSILDNEKEVMSSQGKGHVIIPIYFFSANNGSTVAQAGARQDQGGLAAEGTMTGGKEGSDQHPTDTLFHKYCIQAEVLRESWSLDESLASFVQKLRDMERNEMRVFGDILDGTSTSVAIEQHNRDSQKSAPKSTPKAKEREKDKDKLSSKSSFTMSQNLDTTKPHWILRVASDQTESGSIEVKKDTEKLEEIRAMKLAWETADPGRAAKAHQTRLRYLKQQQEGKEPATAETGTPQAQQSREINALTQNNIKIDIDYSPFIRKSLPQPRLKDEVLEEEHRRERAEKFQSFRLIWDNILEQREKEKTARRDMMKRQLETYIGFQNALDEYRQKMLQAREAYCSRVLEDPSHKKKEEVPVEAAVQVEVQKNPPQIQPGARKSGGRRK